MKDVKALNFVLTWLVLLATDDNLLEQYVDQMTKFYGPNVTILAKTDSFSIILGTIYGIGMIACLAVWMVKAGIHIIKGMRGRVVLLDRLYWRNMLIILFLIALGISGGIIHFFAEFYDSLMETGWDQ